MKQATNWRAVVVVSAMGISSALSAQQTPTAESAKQNLLEELIRTPIVPQRSAEEIDDDKKAAEAALKQVDESVNDAEARIKEADGWLAANKDETNAADEDELEQRNAGKPVPAAGRGQIQAGCIRRGIPGGLGERDPAAPDREAHGIDQDEQDQFHGW